ncbi:WD40 repeat-like protein [Cristinia sonorae]|uniref:WD40 repeat-like protein n=1 Tax=Cristinia sonorae TaxID=1940300 RepID=A0A8K0ULB4_9AGAR|nr:WD40 repeat-like protein [Cristinia sonorae]
MSGNVWDVDEAGENADTAAYYRAFLNAIIAVQGRTGGTGESEAAGRPGVVTISREDIQRYLGLTADEEQEGEDDEDEDDEEYIEDDDEYPHYTGEAGKWFEEVKEPKPEGLKLLNGGEFGRIGHQIKSRANDNNVARSLLQRRSLVRPMPKEDIAADMIPNSNGTAVASYQANAYVGQYSSDSSFYYTCVRDFRLHIYDTTSAVDPAAPGGISRYRETGHETSMKLIKSIRASADRWTITDSHLSPDNQRMIYATVSNNVYMTSTLDASSTTTAINFADRTTRRRGAMSYEYDEDSCGIWSCKFSADGNEIVAGGREAIFVYDLLAQKRTVKIKGHDDDINSCCWADTASGNILISASDDTFLKVWDRRSLGESQKPSGVLIGHTEGITYVSAKGDGRYVISNGKDQNLRLWDLRMMRSNEDYEQVRNRHYGIAHFDYRSGVYTRPKYKAHPKDCSVMQYTGHAVLRTLIRCHFSPAETTGGQYIYSGSADGRIHVWSLDGRVVQVLDRSETQPMSMDPSGPDSAPVGRNQRKVCVRDVSWHSQQPILMSAGWLGSGWGSREGSIIARHEWKGLSKMGYAVTDWIEKQKLERAERAAKRTLLRESSTMPGAFVDSDDESALRSSKDRIMLLPASDTPEIPPVEADLSTYGFPQGYFVVHNRASDRLLDVEADMIEDGTQLILWPEKEHSLVEDLRGPESNNQVFFIDTSGALCSRSSGHAIDVEKESLVLRHRRPVSHPFPNAYSHPLPRFSYDRTSGRITVTFAADPTYPASGDIHALLETWKEKTYVLAQIPMRKPRTIIDDASELLTSALNKPLHFFGAHKLSSATPDAVFTAGDIDLKEDEILELERSEEGEVDNAPELRRYVRVLALSKEEERALGEKAKNRLRWDVIPLRSTKQRTHV